jgi:hypothetical protein
MTCDDHTHSTTIEVIEPAPPEVTAGAAITLKVKAFCPRGCDLTGMPIKVVAADGALGRTGFASGLGQDDVAEMKLEAPSQTGEHIWRFTFGPHEVAGIRHDEVTVPVRTVIIPHATSLAVWSIPSPVVMGSTFAIEIGAKSSAGVVLAAEHVVVRNESGTMVAQGRLGEAPHPGTTALYWTSVQLAAPTREGLHIWSVECEPRGPDLPHERGSTTFSVAVVGEPEHRLTIKVIEPGTSSPIADAEVRLGAYRAATNPLGIAEVDMPKGVYELDIWKVGYAASTRTVRLDNNMLVEVEVFSVPEEDPDAAWLM